MWVGTTYFPKFTLMLLSLKNYAPPWEGALVVKLLGKSIGYNTMKDCLKKVWKIQGGYDIVDIDHEYYMVKFDLAEDREDSFWRS